MKVSKEEKRKGGRKGCKEEEKEIMERGKVKGLGLGQGNEGNSSPA